MAPINPRKRTTPPSISETSYTDSPEPAAKRQKCDFTASRDPLSSLATPPATAGVKTSKKTTPTLSLTVKIPQHVPDAREKRQLAARKAAAKRWSNDGKLQNSYPTKEEIKAAYSLKLMRHYPSAPAPITPSSTATTSTPTPTPEANFVRPKIQKSSRVAKLLSSFPKLAIPTPKPETFTTLVYREVDLKKLVKNQEITATEEATRLAWECFADPDYPTRECMVDSGLPSEDLDREYRGLPNRLPGWKKHRTSRYLKKRATV